MFRYFLIEFKINMYFLISLGDEEQEVSCYDRVIAACNYCRGKCSGNEQPSEAIELSEIIHPNQQNLPLEEAAPLLQCGSGSSEEVGDIVLVHENPSKVKGNVTPLLTIYLSTLYIFIRCQNPKVES